MRKLVFILFLLIGPCTLCLTHAQSQYNVPSSGNQTRYTCDALIYDVGGPNNNYSNNCTGYIVIYPDPNVPNSMACISEGTYDVEEDWDYIRIYNGVGTGGALLAEWTGSGSVTTPIVSTAGNGALTILFESDGSICYYAGFELHATCVTQEIMSGDALSTCSMIWTDPGGFGNYSNGQDFLQTIYSNDGNHVSVSFSSFSLSSGDYLYVYDGEDDSAPLLGSYTGTTLPPMLFSSADCLTFHFTSNSSGVSSGWVAMVECSICGPGSNPASTAPGSPCAFDNIRPFCTDDNEGQYQYSSGTTGSAMDFFGITSGYLGCVGIAWAPAWYFMRIEHPGNITIQIGQHSLDGDPLDVDFACWGPFVASSSADFVQNLCCGYYTFNTERHNSNTGYTNDHYGDLYSSADHAYPYGNLVDCSYDPATTEVCHITNAHAGEYYLLMITNYDGYDSGEAGVVTFNTTSGSTASTDCSIMAEVSNDGPYCVGDTIHLFCGNPQANATYAWTGPGGWFSSEENPIIYPATIDMNGNEYSLVKTIDGTSSSPATTTISVVQLNTSIVVQSSTTICPENQITLRGLCNSTGDDPCVNLWSPGGQSSQNLTVSPRETTTYYLQQTSGPCVARDSVTVTVLQTHPQTYTYYDCCNLFQWPLSGQFYAVPGTYTYPHPDENGCLQYDTLRLFRHPVFEVPVNQSLDVQCADQATPPVPPVVVNACQDTVIPVARPVSHQTNGCLETIVYTWDYTDCSGSRKSWTFTYRVEDNIPPTFTPPVDVALCPQSDGTYVTDTSATGTPSQIEDNCSSAQQISVSFSDVVMHGNSGQADTLLRTWAASDACQNRFVWNQKIVLLPSYERDTTVASCGPYEWEGDLFASDTDVVRHYTTIYGCDSVLTLHLTVNYPDSMSLYDEICADSLPYRFVNGLIDTTFGPGTPYHSTVLFPLSTVSGCDSVVTLHLTVHYPQNSYFSVEAYDRYFWMDSLYSQGGLHFHFHTDENGCEQVDTLFLVLHYSSFVQLYDTVCGGYTWNGHYYDESGDYEQYFVNVDGADSTVVLHLTVNYDRDTVIYRDACDNYVSEWGGHEIFTESGVYEYHLETESGCDSTIMLHLVVHTGMSVTLYDTIAENQLPYHYINGQIDTVFPVGIPQLSTINTQLLTLQGCDSLVTLNLWIWPNATTNLDSVVCEGDLPLVWNGVTFQGADTLTTALQTCHGADSLVTMILQVNHNATVMLYDTIVENQLPYRYVNGQIDTVFPVGTPQHSTINAQLSTLQGCDSLITLNLWIWPNATTSLDSVVCEGDLPLVWNGVTFQGADTLTTTLRASHGADSLVTMIVHVNHNASATLHDTIVENQLPYHYVNGQIDTVFPVGTPQYSTINVQLSTLQGCDSLVTLNLWIWPNATTILDSVVCEGDLPLVWNGVTFQGADTLITTMQTSHGADSLVMMILHVNHNVYVALFDTIVENQLPYHYVNGRIDTVFPVGTPQLSTVNAQFSTLQGCDSLVTLNLWVWPNVSHSVDTTVCENSLPIRWHNIEFEAAGDSTVLLSGAHGEDSLLILHLNVSGINVEYVQDWICEGSDYLGHGFVIPGGQTVNVNGNHMFVENTFQNQSGCDSIIRLDLEIIDTQLYIVSLQEFCDEHVTVLSAVSAMTDYVWSSGETVPVIEVTEPGLYSVTATDGQCAATALYRVVVCETEIRLPNAITPGKRDGHNDCFTLPEPYRNQISELEIWVFNRWGEVVFYSRDKNFEWRGDCKGEIISGVVYNYVIKYMDLEQGKHQKKGCVTVL